MLIKSLITFCCISFSAFASNTIIDHFDDQTLNSRRWAIQTGSFSVERQRVVHRDRLTGVATLRQFSAGTMEVMASVSVLKTPAGTSMGVVARYEGPGDTNMYWAPLVNNGNGTYAVHLYRNLDNVWTFLGAEVVSTGEGTVGLYTWHDEILVEFNGAPAISIKDPSPLRIGSAGFRGVLENSTLDYFSVQYWSRQNDPPR